MGKNEGDEMLIVPALRVGRDDLVRLFDRKQEPKEGDEVYLVERTPENSRGELFRHFGVEADLLVGPGRERCRGARAGHTIGHEGIGHQLVPRGSVIYDVDGALQRLRRPQEQLELVSLGLVEGQLPRAEHRRRDDGLV